MAEGAVKSRLLSEDAYSLAYAYSHLGTIHRRIGDLQTAQAAYDRAVHIAAKGQSGHALINASSNLAFARLSEGNHASVAEIEECRRSAVEYGMHFVALKCQFFLATHLHQVAGPRDGLEALSDWAEAAITLGHINFMSQELILLPYMTRDFLSHEGRDSLCGDVIEAIARGPSSLPLLMRLMEDDESSRRNVPQLRRAADSRGPRQPTASCHTASRRLSSETGSAPEEGGTPGRARPTTAGAHEPRDRGASPDLRGPRQRRYRQHVVHRPIHRQDPCQPHLRETGNIEPHQRGSRVPCQS